MTATELLTANCFHVEVDGVSAAAFVLCRGLEARREVLEYREGGAATPRLFHSGPVTGRLVLERGFVRDRTLWDWYQRGDPRSGAVLLLDASGQQRERWVFDSGWPCAWKGPRLDARSGEVALELVEIVHEGLQWEVR